MRTLQILLSVCLMLVTIVSCNKDDSSLSDPGNSNGGLLTEEKRVEVLGQVESYVNTLSWANRKETYQQVVTYLKTVPQFEDAGYAEETNNVWARFTDGRMLTIANNRKPGVPVPEPDYDQLLQSQSGRRNYTNARVGLPENSQVQLFSAMGNVYKTSGYARNVIKHLYHEKGYQVSLHNASIENLKQVQDVGVFYFSTHGARGLKKDNTKVFTLWTTDSVTVANEKRYKEDFDKGNLGYFIAYNNIGRDGKEGAEKHYAITGKFVEEYMGFSRNSLMYIDACGSFTDTEFIFSFLKKSAHTGTYLGWTFDVIDSDGYKTAVYFFDRLLGSNAPYEVAKPEDPKQRSFSVPDVFADMLGKDLGKSEDAEGVAYLSYKESPNHTTLLRPSIAYLQVDEINGFLYVWGTFGDDPGPQNRKVTIDGVEVMVKSWMSEIILCEIENTGKGSAGDVIVEVGAHKSHPRTLSEWRGQITYVRPSEGSMEEKLTFNIHLRADINHYREKPGQKPIPVPPLPFEWLAKDSKGTYAKGGSATHTFTTGCTYTTSATWTSIQGELPVFDPIEVRGNPNAEYFNASVDLTNTGFVLDNLSASIKKQVTVHMKSFFDCPDGKGENPIAPYTRGFDNIPEKLRKLNLAFDGGYNIKPGKLESREISQSEILHGGEIIGDPIPTFIARIEWGNMQIKFPPRKDAAVRVGFEE